MTPEDRKRMRASGVHEAGHAIVAALHGGHVRRAEVLRSGRTVVASGIEAVVTGYTRYDSGLPDTTGALIAAAGVAAEAMFHHGLHPSAAQVDALLRKSTHDVAKMRQHAYRTNRPVLDAVFDVLPLVRRCWGPIVNLALELEQGNAIGHRDVIAALSIPSDTETEGYAAAIRGGQTPGTFTLTAAAG